jgi:DNA replication factor GINS
MYEELYKLWRNEVQKSTLEELPQDFYLKAADYLRKIREESRMLDKKTLKARLLHIEMLNVKHMLQEVLQIRHEKMFKKAFKGKKISPNLLTNEERSIFLKISLSSENLHDFAKQLLEGHHLATSREKESKTSVLRFLRDVPALVGKDMKAYGPFRVEDVASMPIENANILIKQCLAEKINVN